MKNILFVQFANSMFKRHNACDTYWDVFYKRWENIGYYMGENTFEIPKWIAEISYFLPNDNKEVFWCKNHISEVINRIKITKYDFVLFSLMNANQQFIYDIVKACPKQKFLIGGYNDQFMWEMRIQFPNIRICNTTKDTARELGATYKFGTDYTLFNGERVIPRLTMSYGCLNNCKFCIVPHGKITSVEDKYIEQQIKSFEPLDYRLIYIDDKTFGQADNYHKLKDLSVMTNKNDFNGFIVQTTSPMLVGKSAKFNEIGVKVAEIGLESYNDEILRKYRKPSSEKAFDMAVEAAKENDIRLIANIIVGLPEETIDTYQKTYDRLMFLLSKGYLIGVNPAIYTNYDDDANLGEIDFKEDEKTELHKEWWDKFNNAAAEILSN